jgi:hypothetical protein
MKFVRYLVALTLVAAGSILHAQILPPGGVAQLLDNGFQFTEGPLYDGHGDVYFSDLGPSAQQSDCSSPPYEGTVKFVGLVGMLSIQPRSLTAT